MICTSRFKSVVILLCGIATASCSRGGWRTLLIDRNTPVVVVDGTPYHLNSATHYQRTQTTFSNALGSGEEIHITGAVTSSVSFEQVYYIPKDAPYFLTRLTLISAEPISSNYIAPLCVVPPTDLLPQDSTNRVLFVPYDNDEWITYSSNLFGGTQNSYEVGALYSATTHQGLILGSIEHTDWKSALTSTTEADGTLSALTLYAGAADSITRDSIPHGALRGKTLSSPLMWIGKFDDWRTGMEVYADQCARHAQPAKLSNPAKPFLWNSWGVIAGKLNRDNAFQSAEFIYTHLYKNGFQNEGTCYVGLDSFWDHMSEEELTAFAHYCTSHGMQAGIYWTPFVDWNTRPNREVEGAPGVRYSDIWLYRNGRPVKRNNACALDPTHPATRARAIYYMNRFIDWGYTYLKMDFMIHGALEADSWYNSAITTGTQAYNYGMRYLDSLSDGRLFLNLSIAPVFPANYAQGRRIACDAWAGLKDAKYTLNATTYSWWLDHVYSYNDGDHVVLKGQPENINRLRIASSVITGAYCLGDDFSQKGEEAAKEKAVRLATNPLLLAMAHDTKAFRPVSTPIGNEPANEYYYATPTATYLACFNFDDQPRKVELPLKDLGVPHPTVITELWSGSVLHAQGSTLHSTIPPQDCFIYKIED